MPLFKIDESDNIWSLVDNENSQKVWRLHGELDQNSNFIDKVFSDSDLLNDGIYEAPNLDAFLKITYLEESFQTGWIDKSGQFWGTCDGGHTQLYAKLLQSYAGGSVEGWVHVRMLNWFIFGVSNPNAWDRKATDEGLTEAQKQTLLRIGRNPEDIWGAKDIPAFRDVYPEGHPIHLLPDCQVRRYKPDADKPIFTPVALPIPGLNNP